MRGKPFAVAGMVLAALLAGCSGGEETVAPTTNPEERPELEAGKGAIAGLLIDDIYRPIPGALVLLQGTGLTATTDASGQFRFLDLLPGSYVAITSAQGHEAAPVGVDVVVGEYADLEVSARRLFSEDGHVITTQYSVFIACSAEAFIYAATNIPCGDVSGDSSRASFNTDLVAEAANITVMVTEVKFSQQGNYAVVIGLTDSTNTYDTYYSEADVVESDYVKIVNVLGEINVREGENVGGRNTNFTVDPPFRTTIFPHGLLYKEMHAVCPPETPVTNEFCFWGAGAIIAVKANIVQSVFIGEPKVDIETYQVFSAST